MFTITDQAFLAMAPIKTYSHISMTLLETWTTVICIKYQWTALMVMQNFIRNFQHISKKAISISYWHWQLFCSLHIINRSFTTGAEKSGWKLQKVW